MGNTISTDEHKVYTETKPKEIKRVRKLVEVVQKIIEVPSFNQNKTYCYILITKDGKAYISLKKPNSSLIMDYEKRLKVAISKVYLTNISSLNTFEDSKSIARDIVDFNIIKQENSLTSDIIENIDSIFIINKRILLQESSADQPVNENDIKNIISQERTEFTNMKNKEDKAFVITRIIKPTSSNDKSSNYKSSSQQKSIDSPYELTNGNEYEHEHEKDKDIILHKELDEQSAKVYMKKFSLLSNNHQNSSVHSVTLVKRCFEKSKI